MMIGRCNVDISSMYLRPIFGMRCWQLTATSQNLRKPAFLVRRDMKHRKYRCGEAFRQTLYNFPHAFDASGRGAEYHHPRWFSSKHSDLLLVTNGAK